MFVVKKIGIGLVALIVALCVVIALQPSSYSVQRSTTIEAPPEVVYGILSDLNRFESWSPFARIDPATKVTVTGAAGEPGQKYEWTGNDDVGAGEMSITSVEPGKHVKVDMRFIRPFESTARVTFSVAPEGAGSKATWGMDADNNFMGKAVGLVMDMDKMLGAQFDEGLANLKRISEADAKAKAAAPPADAAGDVAAATGDLGPAAPSEAAVTP